MSPSPETCFENSLKLAPDQLETYESLYAYYQRHGKEDKAEAAARRLLERFPDHAPVQESLADLYMHQGRYDEALELFQKALRTNPLSRQLRGKVSSAHLFRARAYAEAGQFDEARADYRASLSARDGENYPALCKWAACEFKAGNPERAEELLSQALSEAGTRLAIAFNMVIEAIRLKLPRPLKTRFDREFNAALAEPPTGAAAAAILGTTSSHRLAGVTYHGQKTHEKKVLAYVQKAQHADFTEDQLLRVCTALLDMDARRPLHTFTAIGEQRFPANPYFPFTRAEGYMRDGPAACPVHYVQPLLEKARRLAEQMPRDTRQQGLLKAIQEREQMVRSLNPFLDVFGGGFGPPFDAWDDQGGEEDWDDDDTW